MKKLILLLLLLSPGYLLAQNKAVVHKKTVKAKAKSDQILWILDSVKVRQEVMDATIKHTDIADITMLSKDEAQSLYKVDNVGIVTTKTKARRDYKAVFSAISPEYKKYLADNSNADTDIAYYIDGVKVDEVRPLNTIWNVSKKAMLLVFKPHGINENDKGPVALIIKNKEIGQ